PRPGRCRGGRARPVARRYVGSRARTGTLRLVKRSVAALVVTMLALAACGSGGPRSNGGPSMSEPTPSPTGTSTVSAPGSSGSTGVPSSSATPTPTSPRSLAWGPTREEYARAQTVVAEMSTEQQAGQVIVATYQGAEPPVDLVDE